MTTPKYKNVIVARSPTWERETQIFLKANKFYDPQGTFPGCAFTKIVTKKGEHITFK